MPMNPLRRLIFGRIEGKFRMSYTTRNDKSFVEFCLSYQKPDGTHDWFYLTFDPVTMEVFIYPSDGLENIQKQLDVLLQQYRKQVDGTA